MSRPWHMARMDLTPILESIATKYPSDLVNDQIKDIPRIAFHINLILSRKGANITLCDIGGGIGLFSVGCAALGMNVTLIDDFNDSINKRIGNSIFEIHKDYNINIISTDVIANWLDLGCESIDAFTIFDSMEHWHHSPKVLFRSMMRSLRPGGLFIIGAPNCCNFRKRLSVPLGYNNWSDIKDWYEPCEFRGHVREPIVSDLLYIASDIGLKNISMMGKNWAGRYSNSSLTRIGAWVFDKILQRFPSLCSDIYMIGFK